MKQRIDFKAAKRSPGPQDIPDTVPEPAPEAVAPVVPERTPGKVIDMKAVREVRRIRMQDAPALPEIPGIDLRTRYAQLVRNGQVYPARDSRILQGVFPVVFVATTPEDALAGVSAMQDLEREQPAFRIGYRGPYADILGYPETPVYEDTAENPAAPLQEIVLSGPDYHYGIAKSLGIMYTPRNRFTTIPYLCGVEDAPAYWVLDSMSDWSRDRSLAVVGERSDIVWTQIGDKLPGVRTLPDRIQGIYAAAGVLTTSLETMLLATQLDQPRDLGVERTPRAVIYIGKKRYPYTGPYQHLPDLTAVRCTRPFCSTCICNDFINATCMKSTYVQDVLRAIDAYAPRVLRKQQVNTKVH